MVSHHSCLKIEYDRIYFHKWSVCSTAFFSNLFSVHHLFLPVFNGIVAIILKNCDFFSPKYPSWTFSADIPEMVRLDSSSPQPLDSYTHLDSDPLCVAFLFASESYLLNFETV